MESRDFHLRHLDLRFVRGEDSGERFEHHSGGGSRAQQRRARSGQRPREARGHTRRDARPGSRTRRHPRQLRALPDSCGEAQPSKKRPTATLPALFIS